MNSPPRQAGFLPPYQPPHERGCGAGEEIDRQNQKRQVRRAGEVQLVAVLHHQQRQRVEAVERNAAAEMVTVELTKK